MAGALPRMSVAASETVRVQRAPAAGASKHIIGVELSVASPEELGCTIQSNPAEHGVIRIGRINPKGAVAANGMLKEDDHIIMIANYDVADSTHDHVVELLREHCNSDRPLYIAVERTVKAAVITRECTIKFPPGYEGEAGFKIISLGLGDIDNRGAPHVIAEIIPNTPAHEAGDVQPGDEVVRINDTDAAPLAHQDLITLARKARATGQIRVLFTRPEGVKPAEGIRRNLTVRLNEQEAMVQSGGDAADSRRQLGMEFSRRVGDNRDPAHSFGVLGVHPDGAADRAGVHEGDVILSIEGTKLTPEMTRDDVERLLLSGGSEIDMLVTHSPADDRVENDETRVIKLRRDKYGRFGLKLSHSEPDPPSYPRVIGVFPGGPAAQYGHGIRVGDDVLKLDGSDLRLKSQDEVIELMNADAVEFELRHNPEPLPGAGEALDEDSGLRTKVVRLSRDGARSFGLHVGSAHGVGQPVRVHAVDADSVSSRAQPRIEPGDVIATVNKKFILGLGATHQDVTSLMRKAQTLELMLIEGSGFDECKMATITKDAGGLSGLHISTAGESPDTGYVHRVNKVIPGLPAYYATVRYGTIDFGDRLLMMNGVSVRDVNHEHLVDMMRAAPTLVLILRHDPSDLALHTDVMQQVGDLWTLPKGRKEHTVVAWDRTVELRGRKGDKKTTGRVGGVELYKEHGLPGVRIKPNARGDLDKKTRQLAPGLQPHDVVLQVRPGGDKTWHTAIGLDASQVNALLKTSKTKRAQIVVAPHDEFDKLLLHRRTVTLQKTEQDVGWGIKLQSKGHMGDHGARVGRIILESPAGRTGDIHPGDDIVTVNGKRTWHMEHKDILDLFAGATEVTLEVQDHYLPIEDDDEDWAMGPEYQRRVCLTRGELGLGIEVCGDEAPFQISNVVEGKVAWKSSNVFVRDIILEVNGTPVEGLTHDQVIDLIQDRDPVELLLQTTAEDLGFGPDMSKAKDVTLVKHGASLGLVVVESAEHGGSVRIVGKMPGTVGDKEPAIALGDQIVAISGVDVASKSQEEVTAMIRDCVDAVEMTLVPNSDAYVRDVELSAEPGHIDIRTTVAQGGVFVHQIADVRRTAAGPNFWWDLHNTLVYRGDTIESVDSVDARFLDKKELLRRIESSGGGGEGAAVSLVIRTDFGPEDPFDVEEESSA